MKAVVIDEFGGPGVLHVADRELPEHQARGRYECGCGRPA